MNPNTEIDLEIITGFVKNIKSYSLQIFSFSVAVGPENGCSAGPEGIEYAFWNCPSPSGQVGDIQTFTCDGNFMWNDTTTGRKPTSCQADGSWTKVQYSCIRMSNLNQLSLIKLYILEHMLYAHVSLFVKIVRVLTGKRLSCGFARDQGDAAPPDHDEV